MVERYNSKVLQQLHTEGLTKALIHVETQARTEGWSQELEEEYNHINDKQYSIRKKVEEKIRHIRRGAIPWSPKLQKFRTNIEIWSLLLKKAKGFKHSKNKLRRLLLSSDIQDAYCKTLPEIEDALSTAHLAY